MKSVENLLKLWIMGGHVNIVMSVHLMKMKICHMLRRQQLSEGQLRKCLLNTKAVNVSIAVMINV